MAAALNCRVDATLTDGVGGSIVIVDTVGFWKKPLQLTARAKVESAAKAMASRSLCFMDDIVVETPWTAVALARNPSRAVLYNYLALPNLLSTDDVASVPMRHPHTAL